MNSLASTQVLARLLAVVCTLVLAGCGVGATAGTASPSSTNGASSTATPRSGVPSNRPTPTSGAASATPIGPRLPRLHATPATPPPVTHTDRPVRLTVTSVGLDLPIVSIGVGAGNLLALPPNPVDVGWYSYGPAPGDAAGSTLIAGHLDSFRYGLGPLVRLRAVEKGDPIEVTTKAGHTISYRVTDVQRVPRADLASLGVFDRTGTPILRIVTCGGSFTMAAGYSDNLVVTARPTT